VILLNGQSAGGGSAVELEVANSGQMYANALGQWWEWNGSGWPSSTNPSAGPVTTPASLTVAANSTPTAIGIAPPTDPNYSTSQLTAVVTQLPNDGTVYLADGVTRVTLSQSLTMPQLSGLEFAPAPGVSAQSAQFTYTVSDPAGLSAAGAATLAINQNTGHILAVGPGQQYSTIGAAIAASQNGDTIQVQAGTYTNDFATINDNITLQGVGGMVNMVGTQQIPNGKAILITNGDETINNFSFSGAQVADANGAGIRYQAGNLILNNDYFHDNQDGLLSAPNPTGTITINNSEFAHNGIGDGRTHNLYVGDIGALTINDSYFHDAIVGHEIKSRAETTIIENSRIQNGPTGTASYGIDLPNGGNALIENNVIEKGPMAQNPVIITSGEEGGVYANTSLNVDFNTVLNDLTSSSALAVRNSTSATAEIMGNQFYGLTNNQIASGLYSLSNNTFLTSEPALITTHPWSG
jgi:hypothetical protein